MHSEYCEIGRHFIDTSALLVINSNRIGAASVNTSEISFPKEEDLVNYTHQVRPARISIPGEFLLEEMPRIGYNGNFQDVRCICYINME